MTIRRASSAYLTLAEFESLPNDGRRYELIDGRLIVTPAPTEEHQSVSLNLGILLVGWVRPRGLGKVLEAPFEVLLEGEPPKSGAKRARGARAVQPDLLFVCSGRLSLLDGKRLNGAPDLVVEIFHHATALYDTEEKRQLYALHGVREYWQIDLDRKRILVLELTDAGYEEASRATEGGVATSKVLPGFEAPWAEVFRMD